MTVPERNIQVELYRILQNVIREKFTFDGIEFVDVRFEGPTTNGRPDLVIEAREKGKPIRLLVIETKRKVPYIDRKFDPFSKDVIKQAAGYALDLGAPYFATCNGETLVLFDTFTVGVPLPQRRLKHYKVLFDENFAKMLLEELGRFRIGVGKWLPLDDVFVERLRSFHRFITPFMYRGLDEKIKEDASFKEEYVRWLKSQLFEYSDRVNENIAEQMAYLLMNKIAFYKTLETQIPALNELKKIDAVDGAEYSEKLKERFNDVVSKADYEGIFQTTILDKVPLPSKLVYHFNEFIEELGAYNLAKIRSDVLGRVYEDLIPADERHRLGQYYTPPPIVELIVEMCVKSPNDKVLDPGCGSGSFLVKAYHKLRDLKKKENSFRTYDELHNELLEQIYGIDINPFPAQLSSINLAIRNLKVRSEQINLLPSDFFKIKPSMPLLPKEFDVVVTNPPYTRQEEMDYKEQIRDIALTYTDGSKIGVDARASIYAYFFTHSAKFLKDGGRMGYITSNTWLDVGFGKGLKQFFLNHFKLNAIVEFDAAVFGKALVNTCIPILEKCEYNEESRRSNVVRFVRLKKPADIKDVVRAISVVDKERDDSEIRILLKKQSDLKPEEKWGKYLRAPLIYFKIVGNPKITKLEELAKIKYGIKTGCNQFFILKPENSETLGIESRYLKPSIVSNREIEYVDFISEDVSNLILLVHESRDKLEGSSVLKYIEHGEQMEITTKRGTRIAQETVKGVHNLTSCKSRKTWYDLGKKKTAPIVFPYLLWEQSYFVWNKAKAYVTDNFHELYPYKKNDLFVLLGLLNSSITSLLLELHGRSYGGGVLKVQAYELRDLPIIDPNLLSKKEKLRIEKAFHKLCKVKRIKRELETEARKELDNAVFDVFKLKENERKQVYEGLESLRRMRLQRKEVAVLVETAEKWKPEKKPKKVRKIVEEKSTKRLDTWMK